MKRMLFLFSLLFAFSLKAQDNDVAECGIYLKVGNYENLSKVPLELYLAAPDVQVTALELWLTLPEEWVETFAGGVLNRELCAATHSLTQGVVDGRLFVSIASPALDVLLTGDAPLCTWMCNLSALENGEYTVGVTGKFAAAVTGDGVVCYTSPDQQEQLVISDTPASIEEVKGESGKVKGFYNLRGVFLESPCKGEVIIVNGKKVLL